MGHSGTGNTGGKLGGTLIGILVSAALLLYLAKNIEWEQFLQQFDRINWLYLPLLIVLFFLSLWIRAIRWRYLLPSGRPLSNARLFDATVIGLFGTCVLPLRAGEFLRPWILSRTENVSFTAGFASVVTERVFDVLTILGLLGLTLHAIEADHELIRVGAKALGALALVILLVMLLAYFSSELLIRVLTQIVNRCCEKKHPQIAKKILSAAGEFIDGLRAISSYRELSLVLFWSIALWLEMAFLYQVGMWMFGEYPSFWVGISLTVLIALAVAAPSAPGFLGTFQVGCSAALSGIFHYPNEFALAYSVVLHAYQVLLAVISGAYILKRLGLSFSDIRRSSGNAEGSV